MRALAILGQKTVAAMLSLSLVLWSVAPTSTHTPAVFEVIHDHLEMIADHGHSHGLEEDLYWAMHGHSHDVADHDHSQAFLSTSHRTVPVAVFSETRLRVGAENGPSRHFRIDRPPRV